MKVNRKTLPLFTLASLLLVGTSAHAASTAPKTDSPKTDSFLAPKLTAKSASGWSSVILKTSGTLTASQEAQLLSLGADITRRLDFISSLAVTVPTRNLAKLSALPFVMHLSADSAVKKSDGFTEGATGAAQSYQDTGLTGAGVIIAVLDSGVASSLDLDSRLNSVTSFVPGDTSTNDACGHGTHVAGIIAGSGVCSTGPGFTRSFHGIARSSSIVNIRVLDQYGQGTVSSVLAGIQWVVNNKYKCNMRVINLSLGHPVGESYKTDPLCQGVEAAWKAGIVVVCAAGNSGRENSENKAGAANEGWETAYGSIQSPGNDPYVITVGAIKSVDGNHAHDKIATYSSRGPSRLDLVLKPDILAPGNKVISINAPGSYLATKYAVGDQVPLSYYAPGKSTGTSGDYLQLSGTSMAAPVVAGAAAMLIQRYPDITPDAVKVRMMVTADKWAAPDANGNAKGAPDACTYGAGCLNIPSLLSSSLSVTKPALSPTLTQNADGTVSLDSSKIVSASTHIIWGTNGLNDLHIIWGTTTFNGADKLAASHIIWGSSVWSDHVIWGTSTDAVDLQTAAYGE